MPPITLSLTDNLANYVDFPNWTQRYKFLSFSDNLANYIDSAPLTHTSTIWTLPDSLLNYADKVNGGAGVHPPADAMPAYGERFGIGRGFIEGMIPGDSSKVFYTMRTSLVDAKPAITDGIARDERIPGETYLNWVTQELIGVKDGFNATFSITYLPKLESLDIFNNGLHLERVIGLPMYGQYSVSSTTVTLGRAPAFDEWIQARYFKSA